LKRGGVFERPVLRFKHGTALTPFEGLDMGFKPLVGPSDISMGLLSYREASQDAYQLCRNVVDGFKKFKGLAQVFDCGIKELSIHVADDPSKLIETSASIPDSCDVVLALVPDEMMVSYERDPYMPVKRALAERGIPSQMVNYSTARFLRHNSYVLFNLALNIYAKAGGIPWALDEDLHVEAVLGLDAVADGASLMWLCSWRKPLLSWSFEEKESTKVKALNKLLEEGFKQLKASLNKPISSIAIHKEGFYSSEELEVVKYSIEKAVDEGLLYEDCRWFIVSVRRNIPGRIVKSLGLTAAENPDKGTYLQLGKYSVMVCTVGFPERHITEYQSPVRPIMVEVVDAKSWDFDVKHLAKDVYWLSELHWASAFLSTKMPISVLYPSRICSFWHAGLKPGDELRNRLWFL